MEERDIRLQKLKELKEKGINPFEYRFDRTHTANEVKKNFDELQNKLVKVSGRVISERLHGKASFITIRDFSGTIQIYLNINNLGESNYNFFKKYIDPGDFIGVSGTVFKTHTGEITINANNFTLLTKSLLPLPEKYHGIKDVEVRYRKRYLDLIANPQNIDIFIKRSEIIKKIRDYLNNLGFIEVETPMLQPIPGGATAKPFVTFHNALQENFYLRIAPELYLKRLIVGGFEKVYEINRNFRNEGISTIHNPEFTMLELYEAYSDYQDIMVLTENLISEVVLHVNGSHIIDYNGIKINFEPPWKRFSYKEIFEEKTNVPIEKFKDINFGLEYLKKENIELTKKPNFKNIVDEIFKEKVEKDLINPTIIYDFPIEMSPLAKKKRDNNGWVERFEVFVRGMEIANAFSELNDPIDQKERFLEEIKEKDKGDEESHYFDADYIEALEYGMPPTGGLGIGIDRLTMIITNKDSIREVILFPQLKRKEE
ncbi:MAG: lysine--tRNA ligase [Caldisericia bacterium]|jgi:lysyl-tRNA synthetase class 2|nr:lysine--tRNA ligase [Caldisericia bacterium]